MSNEAKMTLEERVVQKIKSDTLMSLVGDEDAILELTRRAVREALYQPKRIPRSYGGFDEKDSMVVEAARDVAKAAVLKVAESEIERLVADPDFCKIVRDALAAALPDALAGQLLSMVHGIQHEARSSAFTAAQEAIRMDRSLNAGR